jgi:hydrogenase maturation protein HypF
MKTYEIYIKGIVQGVGFRPFIYTLADSFDIKGEIYNHSNGVSITINCDDNVLQKFIQKVKLDKPPLSQIDSIDFKEIEAKEFREFTIIESEVQENTFTIMPPDISICKDCESELNDPSNKRYQYPFITCTNCGPRYTIIDKLPYDRVNTSMDDFPMCAECEKEYKDPKDRRYHAQPIGCFNCGPKLSLKTKDHEIVLPQEKIIDKAVEFLEDGKILAIKGVGGYHLVCDATNHKAVKELRARKSRPHKPFAVMLKDTKSAKALADISNVEQKYLSSMERPIVLLNKLQTTDLAISSAVAPDIGKIGLFLAYTPLHLLILQKLDRPIVATSANLSDEPLCTNFDQIQKLSNVWDYCLDHNRDIVNSCDDSVLTIVKDKPLFFRRARGYAPKAIKLPFKLEQNVLALGANQKSTIAIGFEDNVILSPHIGDLNTIGSVEYFKENIENLRRIYDFKEDLIVCDKHPNYESTKYAKSFENVQSIQHHEAHIQAVRLEYELEDEVLGIAFDGTGYGEDEKLWGGEFMLCDDSGHRRVLHFEYFKLLGGEKAVREPRRVALSLLFETYGKDALELDNETIKSFTKVELNTLYLSWQKGLNAPLTSSVGRIFDAVASLSGMIQSLSYEGQSGAMMESFYDESIKESYSYIIGESIDIKPMIKEILNDKDKVIIISKFINTLVKIIAEVSSEYEQKIVLSGGVFQNVVLLNQILDKISKKIYISHHLPPNDGAISLGQIIKGKNIEC